MKPFIIIILFLLILDNLSAQVLMYSINKGPYNKRAQKLKDIKGNYIISYDAKDILYFDKLNFSKDLLINNIKIPYSLSLSDVNVLGQFSLMNNEISRYANILDTKFQKKVDFLVLLLMENLI